MSLNFTSSLPEPGLRARISPVPVGLCELPEVTLAPHILPSIISRSLGDW